MSNNRTVLSLPLPHDVVSRLVAAGYATVSEILTKTRSAMVEGKLWAYNTPAPLYCALISFFGDRA